jgi:hypothetical protein
MAAIIQILKACPAPADPSAPSFLTTLPPEIRNTVYEVLLKRDEPVLVHDADACHATEPTRDQFSNLETFRGFLRRFNEAYEVDIECSAEFCHELELALPLLRSLARLYLIWRAVSRTACQ